MLIAHLSDPHIGPGTGTLGRFAQVVGYLERLRRPVDAVLVTGDLADHGTTAEYAAFEGLRRLGVPLLVLPGNHDSRATFRTELLDAAAVRAPVNQTERIGDAVFLLCDSTVPGHKEGRLSDETLTWLDEELAATSGTPAFVCFHHPPVPVGKPAADQVRQLGAARLATVLRGHEHVVALLCGHVHSAAVSMFAGVPVLTAPGIESTMVLPWEPEDPPPAPPALAFHLLQSGHLTTHYRLCL